MFSFCGIVSFSSSQIAHGIVHVNKLATQKARGVFEPVPNPSPISPILVYSPKHAFPKPINTRCATADLLQAMSIGALPQNAGATATAVAVLADELAFLSGDRSTDISWYGKRGLIAGIYASTGTLTAFGHGRDRGVDCFDAPLKYAGVVCCSSISVFFGVRVPLEGV